jgi:hypothetical protein
MAFPGDGFERFVSAGNLLNFYVIPRARDASRAESYVYLALLSVYSKTKAVSDSKYPRYPHSEDKMPNKKL